MTTPILLLDEWSEAQASPHVTLNEALRWLEAFTNLAVVSKTVATPPGSPTAGMRYIVAAAATGVWTGQAGKVALYLGSAWGFRTAPVGTLAWVADVSTAFRWNGAAWV